MTIQQWINPKENEPMSNSIETGARIRDLRDELRRLERQNEQEMARINPLSLNEEHEMRAMQARADELFRGAGRLPAPEPHAHERPSTYERRLADALKVYSARWAKADVFAMPADAFKVVQPQIYADAAANAKTHGLQATEIRELPSTSASGHRTYEFAGGERAWFGHRFARPARRAVFADPSAYAQMSRDSQMSRLTEIVRHRPVPQPMRTGF
jgi:hypothetical protein